MRRSLHSLSWLLCVSLGFLASTAPPRAHAREDHKSLDVLRHELKVRFDPPQHRLVAADTITVKVPVQGMTLKVALSPKLACDMTVLNGARLTPRSRQKDGSFEVVMKGGENKLAISYHGVIFDSVRKNDDLSWVVGDDTKGVISKQGIYLSGASQWIPRIAGDSMSHFHITTWVPAPLVCVTQGAVPERSQIQAEGFFTEGLLVEPRKDAAPDKRKRTWNKSVHAPAIPTDGVSLSAAPFVVKTRDVQGVKISTYFTKKNENNSDLWLDSMAGTVERYAKILGPYPHPKFDIVENFFQSGYGMPGWTLLGDRVIAYVTAGARRKGGKIPPGYLDHEYVHGWFGNGLFVDYETGNWCEAITTYFSNYLAEELESAEAGKGHRRGVMEKFAIRVQGREDYPVRHFKQKTEDKDNDIGYGKGSMIFHMVRRLIGDEAFFATTKSFTQARVGTVVSWDDWFRAYGEASQKDVAKRIGPWLELRGLPELRLGEVSVLPAESGAGFDVQVAITDSWPPPAGRKGPLPEGRRWHYPMPVHIEGPDARVAEYWGPGTTLKVKNLKEPPTGVRIDPDYHFLRRPAAPEIPHCLNRTLESGGRSARRQTGAVVVDASSSLRGLGERLARGANLRLAPPEFEERLDRFRGAAIVLKIVKPGEKGVRVGPRTIKDPMESGVFSYEHNGFPRTVYVALSEEAAARANYLPFYGWDSWIVFRGGRPMARGTVRAPSRHSYAPLGDSEEHATARIQYDVDDLCRPEMNGRYPIHAATELARTMIEQPLRALDRVPGLTSDSARYRQRFVLWSVHRRPHAVLNIHYRRKKKKGAQTGVPVRPFSFTGERPKMRSFDVGDGARKAAVVEWKGTDIHELYADAKRRAEAQQAGVLYVLDKGQRTALAPWLDTPGHLTAESNERRNRRGRDGKPRPRIPDAPWILARRTHGGLALPMNISIPVLSITREKYDEIMRDQDNLRATPTALVIQVFAGRDPAKPVMANNLVGYWPHTPGDAPEPTRPPVVVLMAHYDALGMGYAGADDNASGVACVREVLRALHKRWRKGPPGSTGLVVAFTDAEEWGLQGSRRLAPHLQKVFDVKAVLNVDSVGRAVTKNTHVIGLSTHPKLARAVRSAFEAGGLPSGADIDKYAYEHGSDHWPFHEAGIPAITVWASDYQVMNTKKDTPDLVEHAGIAKIARALTDLLEKHIDELGR